MDNSPLLLSSSTIADRSVNMEQFHITKKFKVPDSRLLLVDEDQAGNLKIGSTKCCLALTTEMGCVYRLLGKNNVVDVLHSFPLDSLVGASCKQEASYFTLSIHLYVAKQPGCCSSLKKNEIDRKHEVVKIEFHYGKSENERICLNWVSALRSMSIGDIPSNFLVSGEVSPAMLKSESFTVTAPRQRRFLVFVNPVSGKGTAMKVWERTTRPMLDQAAISYKLVKTTHANHARYVTAIPLCKMTA